MSGTDLTDLLAEETTEELFGNAVNQFAGKEMKAVRKRTSYLQ